MTFHSVRLCNLNFATADAFAPFTVASYRFEPIAQGQPKRRHSYTSAIQTQAVRKCRLNACVIVSGPEPLSVLFRGHHRTPHRFRTFTDDILALITILTGRNVRRWSDRQNREFPTAASNMLEGVAKDSMQLRDCLDAAVGMVRDSSWQTRFDDGFHVRALMYLSSTMNIEFRFLSYMAIWEYLFYSHNRTLTDEQLQNKALEQKVSWLIERYNLVDRKHKRQVEKCRVFTEMRNQVAHGGKFQMNWFSGVLENAKPRLCYEYIRLFEAMTENIVLATIGVESNHRKWDLEELLDNGCVRAYDEKLKYHF